jgi:hypothetical protein
LKKLESNDESPDERIELRPSPTWSVAITETLIAVLVVATILAILAMTGQDYDANWIIISLLPVFLWLLLSGRIVGLKAFGVELKSAISQLSSEQIVLHQDLTDKDEIKFEEITATEKDAIDKIPKCIADKVPAFYFELGERRHYEPDAIKEYLNELTKHRFFKWVVFQYADGRFAGLVSAHTLWRYSQHQFKVKSDGVGPGYEAIKNCVEKSDIKDLPGIVEADDALRASDSKRSAVEKFSKLNVDDLSVVDANGKFIGILNRGRLLSDLLAFILQAARNSN